MNHAPVARIQCGQCARVASQSTTRCSRCSDARAMARTGSCTSKVVTTPIAHERRHREVAGAEAGLAGDDQRARGRHHERRAIADLVGGRHRALLVRGRGLDAPGIDGDVLRGREERDAEREHGHARDALAPDR